MQWFLIRACSTDLPGSLQLDVSDCFRHHVTMSGDDPGALDWDRLGQEVVAGRVRLGHRVRGSFAAACGINVRILSDIEKARRSNYDPATLAQVEQALGWATGSVRAVLRGGNPTLVAPPAVPEQPAGDRAVVRQIRMILDSELAANLSADTKLAMIRDVISRDHVPDEVEQDAPAERRAASG